MHRHPLLSLLLLFALLVGMSSMPMASQAQTDDTVQRYFNLTVSLEWQPGTDDLRDELERSGCAPGNSPSYLDDLSAGLRQTSAYLYNYSAGQLALGEIQVYTNGEHWEDADLRILATNSYRPSAFVGGIVTAPTSNISATKGMTETVFYPATIFLGRMWDGNGSRCGPWSESAGWRTIGHEWAHYALFLFDSYYNVTTNAEQYCTSTGLQLGNIFEQPRTEADSLMSYHYSADQLWKGDPAALGNSLWNCKDTPQHFIHGEDDWHTLARFLPVNVPQKLNQPYPFETSQAASNFSIIPAAAPSTDTTAEVRIKALAGIPPIGQAYLIRPNDKGDPQRIIGQGEIIPGEQAASFFWGVQPNTKDRTLITLPDWNMGKRYSIPLTQAQNSTLSVTQLNEFVASASAWNPNISIVPLVQDLGAISRVNGLRVTVSDCAATTLRPLIVFCPAGGDCTNPIGMTSSNGVHTHTFTFQTGTPLYGYIYIRNRQDNSEIATWYQLGGGVGPATGDGHAPLADSWADATPEGNAQFSPTTDDSRLLYSPALRCNADRINLPNDVVGLIGQPLELQPVLGNANNGAPWGSRSVPVHPTLRVRLSYSQDLLNRLGIHEHQLVVLRLVEPTKNVWETVPISARSLELDWVAFEKQKFEGNGAIYALGYRNTIHLPLLMR